MKTYLVGGAVRDKLLGLPVTEQDWVVVGATPKELLAQNFKQVGRDFPVFLHPKTNEEYALARTERKVSPGYHGFVCDFSPTVALEEDLARRDLTINAMALDEHGVLIDPYHGQKDLEQKIFRHVSPSFVEDPVRVLRIARFAARFYSLGFRLADETRMLMMNMVKLGELSHLVPERVWQEWQRSLTEPNPEQFILTLRACDALRVVLPEIHALFGVPNPVEYHPEIDSGIHTILTVQAASRLTKDPVTRFAALTHDLGKALTSKKEWPKHYGHEKRGVSVIASLCDRLRIPNEYKGLAAAVARFHLTIGRLFELRPATIVNTLEQLDAFRRPELFDKILIACQSDAQGCGGKIIDYPQAKAWKKALSVCSQIDIASIIAKGHQGKAISERLHQLRVEAVKSI